MPKQNWIEILGSDWWSRANALADKLCGPMVYPPRKLVFQAFEETQPTNTKVIILGQDCYHSPGKARGVAFGYHPTYKGSINSSMSNIMRECGADVGTVRVDWTTLEHWTEQGVLLLNTRLTVPHERPMGHAHMGWEPLMNEALRKLVEYQQPVVLAWGAEARKMAKRAKPRFTIDTSHPCRYSASRGKRPFLGSGCFDAVNGILLLNGSDTINWTGV